MFERNNDLERKQLAPGVCITTLDASKFNRCRITLHLRFPAKRESATDAAVLALVLERGYAACPDMTALSRRLAELYGADLGVDLASAGTDRVLSADICGIKDAYALAGENLDDPAHRADSQDIRATRDCLKSLREGEGKLPVLECGESGSTLRFLIPVALALQGGGVFRGRGRLMDRPQELYFRIFDGMGITHRREGDSLTVRGRLRPGE